MEPKSSHTNTSALHGITIWLDSYDDLFSDFDPREYDHRALSDDFLSELRKMVRENDEEQDLNEFHLLMPAEIRSEKTEGIITRRLQTYFRNGLSRLRKERSTTRLRGIILSFLGMLFLFAAGFISFTSPTHLGLHLLMITLEPGGWFFLWMGYDNLINGVLRKKSDIDFHVRMTKNRIVFKNL